MIFEYLVILGSVCLLLVIILENYFPTKKLPPGPIRVPLFGSTLQLIPFINELPMLAMKRLTEKYGPVVYLKLGSRPCLIIGEFDTAKFIFNEKLWDGRPHNDLLALGAGGYDLGLVSGNGPGWREMRRFCLRTLRDVGKLTNVNQTMEDGLQSLVEQLEIIVDQPNPVLQVRNFFQWPVLNILWSLVYTVRTPEEGKKLRDLVPVLEKFSHSSKMCGRVIDAFPQIGPIAPGLTGYKTVTELFSIITTYFKDLLDYRQSVFMETDQRADWIDAFISNMKKNQETDGNDPKLKQYTEKQFVITIGDVLFGGAETTSHALEFALYFVSRGSKIQEKVQEEIDRVVDRSRVPNMGDRLKMPYTQAVLLEVNRMANTLALVPRMPKEDTIINGYFIKKGTATLLNMYSIHMSSKFWGDPYTFRPERFLEVVNGQLTVKTGLEIAFGGGTRYCLGELWARTTLFTYFTGLLQNYSFEFVNTADNYNYGDNDAHLNQVKDPDSVLFPNRIMVGFTLHPQPFEVKVKRRQ